MERVTFNLFTDTGGLLLLDPLAADDLGEEFVECLNVVLDPVGATDAAESDGDWPGVWREATAGLRRLGAGGEFTLVLAGEGTFHVRVQAEELGDEERALVVESFEERVRVRSGRLSLTDGGEFFDDELPGEGARTLDVPEGFYSVLIYHLGRHPSLTPTVGVYGSGEHPALILRLAPAESSDSPSRVGEDFPRLKTSHRGYEEPRPGWGCYAQVTGVEGGLAELELMLTETVYSGRARMAVPEGEELKAGDYVLVRLLEDVGGYWRAEWQD